MTVAGVGEHAVVHMGDQPVQQHRVDGRAAQVVGPARRGLRVVVIGLEAGAEIPGEQPVLFVEGRREVADPAEQPIGAAHSISQREGPSGLERAVELVETAIRSSGWTDSIQPSSSAARKVRAVNVRHFRFTKVTAPSAFDIQTITGAFRTTLANRAWMGNRLARCGRATGGVAIAVFWRVNASTCPVFCMSAKNRQRPRV